MHFNEISKIIEDLYQSKGLENKYGQECRYLRESYEEIESLWESQFLRMTSVNYVMLSEAPLWGTDRKYIYNPDAPFSQFFYKSDLEAVTGAKIENKAQFLNHLNEIGFVILDLSPFALNEKDTSVNYRTISNRDYTELVERAAPLYLKNKLNVLHQKSNDKTAFFFRYARVKNLFHDTMQKLLTTYGFNISETGLSDVAQKGGGMDREKLKNIVSQNPIFHQR